jgi:hypothetical protein
MRPIGEKPIRLGGKNSSEELKRLKKENQRLKKENEMLDGWLTETLHELNRVDFELYHRDFPYEPRTICW